MSNAVPAHQFVDTSPGTPDSLDELLRRQADELKSSRWHSVFKGLPHDLAYRIHCRLEQLQRERPLTGVSLRGRCAGVKTTILYNIAGNSRWGRSQLRRSNAYKQHRSKHWKMYYQPTVLQLAQQKQQLTARYHTATGSATDA